jgi:tetratricopeptide (TPR) repeat protein
MNPSYSLLIASLLLTGCAQMPKTLASVQSEHAEQAESADPEAVVEVAPVLPDVELSDELLYEFMLTELAHQRGHNALAVEGSLDIALKTRDPRLAKRAAQLALESGDMNKAVAAFRLWQEIEPASPMATRVLSSLLLRGGKLAEARVEFLKVLKTEAPKVGPVFMQLYPVLISYPDKAAALQLMLDLAAPYPQVSETHWLLAQLAQQTGDEAQALSEVRLAHSQRVEWDAPVALEAQLLRKSSPQQSLEVMHHYLTGYPDSREIRLQYARALLEQKQYQQARDEFQHLSKDSPDNVDLAFAVALISLQLNDLPGAEAQLRLALSKSGKGQDGVEYFLGQLNEAKENEDEALIHYRAVSAGEYQFSAQLRVAYLLNKHGQLSEARSYLQQAHAITPPQRVQLLVIEAQMLRDARQLPEAYQVLQQGLAKLPNNPELLYEAAMQADLLGKYESSERLLRKLIQLQPDNAHAYNALGYSLLERNVRVKEAVVLVEKALQLAPDDYSIMDSVGWGYFRSGKLDESVAMLKRAYAGNPDPEIAAHLGEVLWARGEKDAASQLWQASAQAHPDNVLLQTVIKRFMP